MDEQEPKSEKDDGATELTEEQKTKLAEILEKQSKSYPFGPEFFVTQLRDFVRDRCPQPSEGLPSVNVHTVDGVCLRVCHILGLGPTWVALAVYDGRKDVDTMRTELVPYGTIIRISICEERPQAHRIGFEQTRSPLSF